MNAVKRWAKRTGQRQADVARAVGVSRTTVHHWWQGTRAPKIRYARKLAALAGVTLDQVYAVDRR